MQRKIIIIQQENRKKKSDIFKNQKIEIHGMYFDICSIVYSNTLIATLKNLCPDIIITLDLLGFELCTLTDNISYNLLNCKQIHILLHKNLENEKYLLKPLSIAMFFYCFAEDYYECLINKYPELPYLKSIQRWQSEDWEDDLEKKSEILEYLIQDICKQCFL